MERLQPTTVTEPTVGAAALRHRWLVGAFALGGLVLGALAGLAGGDEFSATAEIVVEDPRVAAVFERTASDEGARYVETQASIMRSSAVAARARELALERDPPIEVSLTDLLDGVEVATSRDSALISITYTDPEADVALAVPSIVAAAYEEERRAAALRGSQAAIDELDRSIAERVAELDALEQQIAAVREATDARIELEQQFDEIISRLVLIQDPVTVPGSGSVAAFPNIASQAEQLRTQLESILLVLQIESVRPDVATLAEQQQSAIGRLSALEARRDQLVVDAELAGGGVVLFSPARRALEVGSGLVRWLGVGLIVGLMIGTGAAYLLALRRRRITVRTEPEALLGAPLLAEVPDFGDDRSPLPVADAPGSAAAEAFRFAAAAVDLPDRGAADGSAAATLVAVASAAVGDGKSTAAGNLALAVARQGHRVLAIDADFGDQAMSRLLLPFDSPASGMVDWVLSGADVADAVYTIEASHRHTLDLLPRGLGNATAPEFFHRREVADLLRQMAARYDLIVVDTPPLLQVAYATTVVGLADSAMVVVGHDSPAVLLEALRDRLDLIGTPVRGYVYNRAPVRDLEDGAGSLQDRLGRVAELRRD